jgi:hypothetical protein
MGPIYFNSVKKHGFIAYQRPRATISIHKLPSRDVKTGAWCAISATRIITPIFFFSKVINSHDYVPHISTKFSEDPFD